MTRRRVRRSDGPARRTAAAAVAAGATVTLVTLAACSGPPAAPVPSSVSPVSPSATVRESCAPPRPLPTQVPTFAHAPDAGVAASRSWTALVRTTCGDLEVVLDGIAAPRSVASFLTLARSGWWRDSACHRLTSYLSPLRFLQCGDTTGHDEGDPGYELPLENVPAGGHYGRGTVALARGYPVVSSAAQFLIVYAPFTAPADGPRYSVVGRVTRGLEVVDGIASRGGEDTRPDGPPFRSISILDVVVEGG